MHMALMPSPAVDSGRTVRWGNGGTPALRSHLPERSRPVPGLRLAVQPIGADVKSRYLGPKLSRPGRRERSRAPGELREVNGAEDAPDSIHTCTIGDKKTRRPGTGGGHSYMHCMAEGGQCQGQEDQGRLEGPLITPALDTASP